MLKLFISKFYQLLIVAAVFSVASCNDGKSKDDSKNTSIDSGKTESPIEPASLISGKLDSLWVDSAAFAALPNRKLVLSFVFVNDTTLTLHGWSQNNGAKEFDSLPNIKLKKGVASKTLTYGNGTYFGSLVLKQSEINKIQNDLRNLNGKQVVFAPRKEGNNIFYRIYISTDNPPPAASTMAVVDTNVEANPSPPKNSN